MQRREVAGLSLAIVASLSLFLYRVASSFRRARLGRNEANQAREMHMSLLRNGPSREQDCRHVYGLLKYPSKLLPFF